MGLTELRLVMLPQPSLLPRSPWFLPDLRRQKLAGRAQIQNDRLRTSSEPLLLIFPRAAKILASTRLPLKPAFAFVPFGLPVHTVGLLDARRLPACRLKSSRRFSSSVATLLAMNTALVFLKPHAATPTVEDFALDYLGKKKVGRPLSAKQIYPFLDT